MKLILTDIEGTTTSIAFVKEVLFPFSQRTLPAFVHAHADEPAVRKELDAVRAEIGQLDAPLQTVIDTLLQWIREDRKITPLKTLQGLVWEAGYQRGELKSHIHPDAAVALRRWHAQGLRLAVYSSGSVAAQQLLFRHTVEGDLTPVFSGYFDTAVGGKKEAASYRAIAAAVQLPPGEILFLSDVAEELDAACEAGVQTIQVVRPEEGTVPNGRHPVVSSFHAINVGPAESVIIRPFEPARDEASLRACFIELQDHEHALDPVAPAGDAIADAYLTWMHARVSRHDGRILMAEVGGNVVGFVTVLLAMPRTAPDDPEVEHALVSELMVQEGTRGQGIGARLLHAAEAAARDAGRTQVRISVFGANEGARRFYAREGYEEWTLIVGKSLTGPSR